MFTSLDQVFWCIPYVEVGKEIHRCSIPSYLNIFAGPSPYPVCTPLCALGLDAFFYRDKLKWIEAYPHKQVCWILLTFFISYISWVLANIMTKCSCCFLKCGRNSHADLYNGMSEIVKYIWWIVYLLWIYTHCQSWWSQWVVIAACHSYTWWRWQSDTLWVILIRFWLHTLSCYLWFVAAKTCLFIDMDLFCLWMCPWSNVFKLPFGMSLSKPRD